jgi:hypothetical protein
MANKNEVKPFYTKGQDKILFEEFTHLEPCCDSINNHVKAR